MNIDDAIKRAHAKEIHPANALVTWHANQLNELPGYDDDINAEQLSLNFLARVMYLTDDGQRDPDADFAMPLPLSHESLLAAASISTHDDVFAVACYDVDDAGGNAEYPAVVFANGETVPKP